MRTINNLIIYESIDEYPWERLKDLNTVSKGRKSYADVIVTFDTETTTLRKKEGDKWISTGAFVYSYQFAINGIPCILRTPEEYKEFRLKMHEVIHVDGKRRLLIFVHNLGYDFEFIKEHTPFVYEDMLAYAPHHVFNIKTSDNEEWRCTYKLSNMSLAEWSRKLSVDYPKQDNFNYDLIRHAKTPLSEDELYYMACDVVGLYGCIIKHMEQKKETLATLKLTSTSYPRSEIVEAALKKEGYRHKIFRRAALNVNTYKLCRLAFRGGNTHGNQGMIGTVFYKVRSRDIASSYPYQLLVRKYPMSRFVRESGCKSIGNVRELIAMERALLMKIAIYNLRLKDYTEPVPYIAVSKAVYDRESACVFNGRLLKSDMCILFITDVDFAIIDKMYKWDKVLIETVYSSKYDYLPDEICNVILTNYDYKTSLKEDAKHDDFAATLYTKAKNILNGGIYGVMATDIVRQDIIYKNGTWTTEPITDDRIKDALDRYYNSWTKALHYQWGVWCTAWARKSLQEAIDIVGKYNFIYCDTDSVKYIDDVEIEKKFTDLNAGIIEQAEKRRAYSDFNGTRYYMGIFDDEGLYDTFVTLGAKRYAYMQDGTLNVTVSGVKKTKGARLLETIDNFKTGFKWSGEDTGKMALVYSKDNDLHEWDVTDYLGNTAHIKQEFWVAMIPSDYTLDTVPYTNDYEISFYIAELQKHLYNKKLKER